MRRVTYSRDRCVPSIRPEETASKKSNPEQSRRQDRIETCIGRAPDSQRCADLQQVCHRANAARGLASKVIPVARQLCRPSAKPARLRRKGDCSSRRRSSPNCRDSTFGGPVRSSDPPLGLGWRKGREPERRSLSGGSRLNCVSRVVYFRSTKLWRRISLPGRWNTASGMDWVIALLREVWSVVLSLLVGMGVVWFPQKVRRWRLRRPVDQGYMKLRRVCEPGTLDPEHRGNPEYMASDARDHVNPLRKPLEKAGFHTPGECTIEESSLKEWFAFLRRARDELGVRDRT